jgi:hypothetical protein
VKKIVPLIYDTVEKENKNWIPKAHYPSSASFKFPNGLLVGPDLLDQWLKWKGVQPSNPSDGPGLLKMRLGNGAHKELEKVLQKSGVKVMSEVAGKYQHPLLVYPISYRVDHLIEDEEGLGVLEVKSSMQQQMYSPYFGIKVKGIKLDHALQVLDYLKLVPGVKRGKLLYIDRGTGGMLEFDLWIGDDGLLHYEGEGLKRTLEITWDGIIERRRLLEAAVKLDTPPEPEYRAWINEKTGEVMPKKTIHGKEFKTNWRVMYSDYKDYIWKNPENFKYSLNANPQLVIENDD